MKKVMNFLSKPCPTKAKAKSPDQEDDRPRLDPNRPYPKEFMPSIFVNHGGGPMPVLDQQPEVKEFLENYGAKWSGNLPRAVLVVTAHWEADEVTVSSAAGHDLIYDYSGFPRESYELEYFAPGEPTVAEEVLHHLQCAGIKARSDPVRGWDHGVFIPMLCMFPEAEVPIVQMSLVAGQDAKTHWDIGAALKPLREKGVLIVGSGLSFHNFEYFFAFDNQTQQEGLHHSSVWKKWLTDVICDPELNPQDRKQKLLNWTSAPSSHNCHPRGEAEHLMPLFVVAGAAQGAAGQEVGKEYGKMLNVAVSQYEFLN
mmetsp:Transcript_21932/g.47864  ORF Transcript_21932/g.47864 Transcript_21932/m.47864 type:complete len:312 (+) Transcript_21932:189-1124(+)|eukprot:CAMPEP_0206448784 /NCGR_PEP_ID=MMETSP0324_2-20121206/17693_1 /ASSEMBLY_ACC=CAM_ASM_000836 /TAXON_ID=2866 /ORGANISM="Crypthecodinium cohnii, Strain Seligo" /LENGTH=311 /DNA_ID=CAMNT_0053918023 /DNA_START=146 /DNA_END=1081 /DNA_ORIENTATION=-